MFVNKKNSLYNFFFFPPRSNYLSLSLSRISAQSITASLPQNWDRIMQITPRFVYSIISPECLHTVLRFSLSDFLISTNGDTSKMRCSRKVEDRVSNNNFECMPRINFPLFLYEVAVREIRWIDSPGTIRMGQQHRFERYYLRLKRKRALTFAGHYNFNNVCFICRRACRSNIFFFFPLFFFLVTRSNFQRRENLELEIVI